MHRTVSQRQAKKVGVPVVPEQIPGPTRKTQNTNGAAKIPLSNGVAAMTSSSRISSTSLDTVQSPVSDSNHKDIIVPAPPVKATFSTFSPSHEPTPKPSKKKIASPPQRHRNSTGSNCSQASSGFESMKSTSQPTVNATVHQLRGDSPPSRNSVHSSGSSSLGSSLERLDESGYASLVNISEMLLNGVPDAEVISAWLQELRYEEYIPLFLHAGYDLPTAARMTPEDLTAIGITKPGHRKRLTTEIHKLNIGDPWPCAEPAGGVSEWLVMLGLGEYVETFEREGYRKMGQVRDLTFEDFEDMGIKRLGHLKKLELGIKKLKDYRNGLSAMGGGTLRQVSAPCQVMAIGPNRTTAEVRPYAHQPGNLPPPPQAMSPAAPRRPTSPQVLMSTFHTPPSPSPQHRRHPSNGYDTFPRRASSLLVTEAMVHQTDSPRPTVSVKPKPREQIVEEDEEVLKPPNDYANVQELVYEKSLLSVRGLSNSQGRLHGSPSPSPSRIQLNLAFSSTYRSPTHSGKPPPPPPPKRSSCSPLPPKKPNRVPHLLPNHVNLNDSFESNGVSPAPSIDFLPPPSITCEESIRTLRTMMSGSSSGSKSGYSAEDTASGSSSTETLPFANENVGTIRSKHSPNPAPERTNVQQIFHSSPSTLRRTPASGQSGDVLNDIGNMLQNLTDELDALLLPPPPTEEESSS